MIARMYAGKTNGIKQKYQQNPHNKPRRLPWSLVCDGRHGRASSNRNTELCEMGEKKGNLAAQEKTRHWPITMSVIPRGGGITCAALNGR